MRRRYSGPGMWEVIHKARYMSPFLFSTQHPKASSN